MNGYAWSCIVIEAYIWLIEAYNWVIWGDEGPCIVLETYIGLYVGWWRHMHGQARSWTYEMSFLK